MNPIYIEVIRFISTIIITGLGLYFGFKIWRNQEVLKSQKESGLKFLSLLKRYSLSINSLRNSKFQLYNTEEAIYQERWNQLVKIWIEIQHEHTLTELLFPAQKTEITLTHLAELQSELKNNIDTYLSRKHEKKWKGDENDNEIGKIIFNSNNVNDEFGDKIKNEIEKISNPIKIQLKKQFNTTF